MKHLISVSDLAPTEVLAMINLATELKHNLQVNQLKKLPTLRGKTIFNLFYENSTRTRSSFEVAGKWLSADVINLSVSNSSVKKGESIKDTLLTISAMEADAIIVRHAVSGVAQQMVTWCNAKNLTPAIINAGDGMHEHPTQALLDAFTLMEHFGTLKGLQILIVGDIMHSRVARSNFKLLSKLGCQVKLVAPKTLLPQGISINLDDISYDLDSQLSQADVVMLLRVQSERMQFGYYPSQKEYSKLFGLNAARFAALKPSAVVLHPGPIIRGTEISDSVADNSNSLINNQVKNGVYMRMAILYRLLAAKNIFKKEIDDVPSK